MKTLSKMNRVGYALGDVGNSLTFGMTSAFLLAYYTDVLGISAAAAGTLFLVARMWDAINDPMMGAFCDKMFSKRKGEKFRPFLLKGSWPVAVAAILVFWAPEGLSDVQKLVWAYATYIIWGMAYTFVNIPYGSLATVMSNDPEERASLGGSRAVGGLIGTIAPNIIIPLFLSIYSDDLSTAYLYSILILAITSIFCYVASYKYTAEHIRHEPSPTAESVSFKATLKTVVKNKPYLCVSFSSMLLLTAMMGQASVLLFYVSENLNSALWLISANSAAMMVAVMVLAPSISKIVGKFGVKKVMCTSFLMSSILCTTAFILPSSPEITLGFFVLNAAFLMIPNILFWANIADCIDYNYEISGQRSEGVLYSSYSFMRKMGQAFAGFIAGMGLSIIGYTAGLDMQSEETLLGLKAVMFILPGACMFVCFLLYKAMWTLGDNSPESDDEMQSDVKQSRSLTTR
ncbi:glycoside-pentoside-hexuronide (GPH):cation symporter [Vibrio aestuarianus]|uniref:Glycoside-pentoside-hexuronide (GPH):cation symporter n=1 Tax=Vibrio aestuarianus TaxID=28171 RepID=A0AAX3U2K7_9VIBR|nr:glycoside-pentoside-hexuronide (GPH):cation symporter [Vibrio aestuarianus]WGK81390.1 glycoside-pentoside-hexuronide (GPH):cation symporter [Vibrio aestuarianus]